MANREGRLDARERSLKNHSIQLDILARRAETAHKEWILVQGQQHAWQNAYAHEDDATSTSSPRSDTYIVLQLEILMLILSHLRTITQEDWRTPMTTPSSQVAKWTMLTSRTLPSMLNLSF